LTAYQQRVYDELDALQSKIEALASFQDGALYLTLERVDKNLLQEQKMAMSDYADILRLRIRRFKE
jgi:hypothetical protein